MPDSDFPRNTTPCPACGVPTLTVRRRYGEGVVMLDVRSAIRCYQLVIHGTGDTGLATAAPSMAYPEHEPLCRGNEHGAEQHEATTAHGQH